MRKSIICLLTVLSCGIQLKAQYWKEVKLYGNNGATASPFDVVVDDSSNSYFVTSIKGETYSDQEIHSNSPNFSIGKVYKVNPQGNIVWTKEFSGIGDISKLKIELSGNDELLIGGNFGNSLSFDGDTIIGYAPTFNIFYSKLDLNGKMKSLYAIKGNSAMPLKDVKPGINGDVVIVGSYNKKYLINTKASTSINDDGYFIVKLDSSNNVKWIQDSKGDNEVRNVGIESDSLGDLYIHMQFTGTIELINTYHYDTVNTVILKIDGNTGKQLWEVPIKGTTQSYITNITYDGDKHFYFSGAYNKDLSCQGIIIENNSRNKDMYLAKISNDGEVKWIKKGVSNENDFFLQVEYMNGYLYAIGEAGDNTTFDGRTFWGYSSSQYPEGFLTKLDTTGSIIWTQNFTQGWVDIMMGLAVDRNENVTITGTYREHVYADNDTLLSLGSVGFYGWMFDSTGNTLWNYSETNGQNMQSKDMAVGSSNHYYTSISFNGIAYLESDTLISNGKNDIAIMKVDSNNNILKVHHIATLEEDLEAKIAVDTNENIYVLGTFYGAELKLNDSVIVDEATNGLRKHLLKISPEGELIWIIKNIGNALDIAADNSNNIYIAYNGLINKFNSSGDHIWSFTSTGLVYKELEIKDTNIYAVGNYTGTVTVGGETLNSLGNSDSFVLKLSTSNNLGFIKSFGGTNNDAAHAVGIGTNGDIYVTGYYSSNITIGDSTTNSTYSNPNLFLVQLDETGNTLWLYIPKSSAGSIVGQDIQIDSDNNIYVLANGDAMPYTSFLTYKYGQGKSHVFMIDHNKIPTWVFRGGGHGGEEGKSLKIIGERLHVTGTAIDNAVFGEYTFNNAGNSGSSLKLYLAEINLHSCTDSSGFNNLDLEVKKVSGNFELCLQHIIKPKKSLPIEYFDYQWYRDGTLLSGANESSYEAVDTGMYVCRVSCIADQSLFKVDSFLITSEILSDDNWDNRSLALSTFEVDNISYCDSTLTGLRTSTRYSTYNHVYEWKHGINALNQTNETISTRIPGIYTVTISDIKRPYCIKTDSYILALNEIDSTAHNNLNVQLKGNDNICSTTYTKITTAKDYPLSKYTWGWFSEDSTLIDTDSVLNITNQGLYFLKIESKAYPNCFDSDSVVIINKITDPLSMEICDTSNYQIVIDSNASSVYYWYYNSADLTHFQIDNKLSVFKSPNIPDTTFYVSSQNVNTINLTYDISHLTSNYYRSSSSFKVLENITLNTVDIMTTHGTCRPSDTVNTYMVYLWTENSKIDSVEFSINCSEQAGIKTLDLNFILEPGDYQLTIEKITYLMAFRDFSDNLLISEPGLIEISGDLNYYQNVFINWNISNSEICLKSPVSLNNVCLPELITDTLYSELVDQVEIVDTFYTEQLDTCFLNNSVAVDSFYIESHEIKGKELYVDWIFEQKSKSHFLSRTILTDSLKHGHNLIYNTLFCEQGLNQYLKTYVATINIEPTNEFIIDTLYSKEIDKVEIVDTFYIEKLDTCFLDNSISVDNFYIESYQVMEETIMLEWNFVQEDNIFVLNRLMKIDTLKPGYNLFYNTIFCIDNYKIYKTTYASTISVEGSSDVLISDISNLVIYPNPFDGTGTVLLPNNFNTFKLSIYNIQGVLIIEDIIKNSNSYKIDGYGMLNGLYFMQLLNLDNFELITKQFEVLH